MNRVDRDRDLTDYGLTDPAQIEAMWASKRARRKPRKPVAPTAPAPRAPLMDEPVAVPSQRPRDWARKISEQQGWTPDPRRQLPCTSCLVGPGRACEDHNGRPMRGVHPEGRQLKRALPASDR